MYKLYAILDFQNTNLDIYDHHWPLAKDDNRVTNYYVNNVRNENTFFKGRINLGNGRNL